jgi:hypothetical protein
MAVARRGTATAISSRVFISWTNFGSATSTPADFEHGSALRLHVGHHRLYGGRDFDLERRFSRRSQLVRTGNGEGQAFAGARRFACRGALGARLRVARCADRGQEPQHFCQMERPGTGPAGRVGRFPGPVLLGRRPAADQRVGRIVDLYATGNGGRRADVQPPARATSGQRARRRRDDAAAGAQTPSANTVPTAPNPQGSAAGAAGGAPRAPATCRLAQAPAPDHRPDRQACKIDSSTRYGRGRTKFRLRRHCAATAVIRFSTAELRESNVDDQTADSTTASGPDDNRYSQNTPYV